MALDNLSKKLLEQVANLHKIPDGAVSIRKNGKSEVVKSSKHIEIFKKEDVPGIDVYVHSTCQNEACHIPVIVTENNLFDETYNDFYIEDGAVVTIVAGCGLHTDAKGGHSGIHTFHIGKNAKVSYVENHLATGKGTHKELSPTTKIAMAENSFMEILTTQLGGVDYANRITTATLKDGANLVVNEKILTDRFDVAKTNFKATLSGKNSKCNIVSRSVAKGESEQEFKSNIIGKSACFGRVECDGILLDDAKIASTPKITAENNLAELSHEAAIGRIAGEQLTKLMTLGLTEKQAETKIIEGFLK
ncbi:MAG: SufD family Fe-S cluster assembly protein [Clostridia bacterium]|nr:SufD family Fe-S cluster assembly protein [Clostridia bacterium]